MGGARQPLAVCALVGDAKASPTLIIILHPSSFILHPLSLRLMSRVTSHVTRNGTRGGVRG
nr:MAG TPA: hypothetical protein [Caudoviricetes sp.]